MTATRTPPAPGPLFWGGLAAAVTGVWLLRAAYFHLDDLAAGQTGTLPLRLMTEGTGAFGALLLAPLVVWVGRRFRPARTGLPATLLAHLAGFVGFSVAHTLFMALTRAVLAPALGFPHYAYGPLRLRLLMEAPSDATTYAVVLGALLLVESVRARRERELHAVALEREVAQAQLANLQLQLQPHFLFNALNTISATMYDDPGAADEMVGHLSELLRHALGAADRREMALGDELRLLESYLALARARFGERVDVAIDVAPGLADALVPPLLLQPLVENAFQHGIAPSGRGRVAVRARRAGGELVLTVENASGDLGEVGREMTASASASASAAALATAPAPAAAGAGSGLGLGLAVTGRRLALLYGDAGVVTAGPTPAPGYQVAVRLPFRTAKLAVAEEADARSHR
ncbi:MAG TPA: histidine kinase [Gemmatimonadales bacterium]|nr:histidine kinase [Gemmatimonadales bacterium]